MKLQDIKNPSDIKKMSISELEILNEELREALLYRLSKKGGHNGPNLGVVELTVALHYVFDSPKDKFIYDISHQSYIHKMLTGRVNAFINDEDMDKITGYTNQDESEHDFFKVGHTSTSISLAHGMAKARDLKGDLENVIAIIGDGSLSGGLALEGLSNVGEYNKNLIIIINDNDQSIAENHGGLYENLKQLRENKGKYHTNLFTAMNLDYKYIENGHDVETLIKEFENVKDITKPIVLHIHTIKGKGFSVAEQNREQFHAGGPLDLEKPGYKIFNTPTAPTFNGEVNNYLKELMQNDKEITLLTAGTPGVVGFDKDSRDKFKDQFIDVGIAEEHATTMVSGLAANKTKPIFSVMSTFLQRTYDQISHDIAINNNSATILVYGASYSTMTDVTHLCYFDIPMISNIPNLVYLAPTTLEEAKSMIKYSVNQDNHPTAIRLPVGKFLEGEKDTTDYSNLNKYEVVNKGSKVAIIGLGNFFSLAKEVSSKLDFEPTLINPKFITGVDEDLIKNLTKDHELIITIEDGQLEGGFGSKISMFCSDKDIKVKNFGYAKKFEDRYDLNDFLQRNNVTEEQIIEYIKDQLK